MTGPRWLDEDEQRAWRAYLESTILLFEALDRQLQRDAGMPHAYYEILVRLSEAPGRTHADERARRPRRTRRAAGSRTRSRGSRSAAGSCGATATTDRRGQLAELTDEGFEVLETCGARAMSPRCASSSSTGSRPSRSPSSTAIGEAIVAGTRADA